MSNTNIPGYGSKDFESRLGFFQRLGNKSAEEPKKHEAKVEKSTVEKLKAKFETPTKGPKPLKNRTVRQLPREASFARKTSSVGVRTFVAPPESKSAAAKEQQFLSKLGPAETRENIEQNNREIARLQRDAPLLKATKKEEFETEVRRLAQQTTEHSLHSAGRPGMKDSLEKQQIALLNLARGNKPLQDQLAKQFKAVNSLVRTMEETDTRMEEGETLASFLEKANLSAEDVELESKMFGLDETVAKMKLAKRAILMRKGGIDTSHYSPSLAKIAGKMECHPSVVKAAFDVYKAHIRGKEPGKPPSLEGHNIYVTGKDVVIEEEIGLAAGSFKLTRIAQVLFKEGKMVTQRPHTSEELKAFQLHKGKTVDVEEEGSEVKELKEKFKEHWTDDSVAAQKELEGGKPGDFRIYWKEKQGQPSVMFVDGEGKVISKSLQFDDVMNEDFSLEAFVKKEVEASIPKKVAEVEVEVEPEQVEEKYKELISKNDKITLPEGNDFDDYKKALKGKDPFTYLINYEPDPMEWDEQTTVELYYVNGSGKTEYIRIPGEKLVAEGFTIEAYIKKMEGVETTTFTATLVPKGVSESSYNLSEMKNHLNDLCSPLDVVFETKEGNRIKNMDTGELQKLKESPKADEEIKVQLDKIIEFKEKIKVREEYLKKFEEARKKGELSEDPDFQYDREVDTSFELGKLGRGIENVSKVIHVEKNGKVVKTMLKPIAGRQLDGSHFVDGKERKIFDMEQLMAEFNKGNLTTEGKIVLLEAYEQALEGSAKMEKEGYIHRDLKPPNILLTSDGAALTDFGSTVRAKDDMRIALYGGTLIYSPPEAMGSRLDLSSDPTQCAGLSSKMDVWSWGMMFHQIVSEEGMADHAIFSGLDLGAIEDKEFDQTIMGHLYQNGFRSEEFREKYETDYHKEPKPAGTLQHLAWECTHLDPDKRPSMAEALTKFRAAKKTLLESLPPPIE